MTLLRLFTLLTTARGRGKVEGGGERERGLTEKRERESGEVGIGRIAWKRGGRGNGGRGRGRERGGWGWNRMDCMEEGRKGEGG